MAQIQFLHKNRLVDYVIYINSFVYVKELLLLYNTGDKNQDKKADKILKKEIESIIENWENEVWQASTLSTDGVKADYVRQLKNDINKLNSLLLTEDEISQQVSNYNKTITNRLKRISELKEKIATQEKKGISDYFAKAELNSLEKINSPEILDSGTDEKGTLHIKVTFGTLNEELNHFAYLRISQLSNIILDKINAQISEFDKTIKSKKEDSFLTFKLKNKQSPKGLSDLMNSLIKKKFISMETSISQFKKIFGEGKIVEPIIWIGTQSQLNFFADKLSEKTEKLDNLWGTVLNCFVDKKKERYDYDNLRKAKEKEVSEDKKVQIKDCITHLK